MDKICPHFHLSLQSGSDSVLKRMNRRYNTEEYYQGVQMLRKYFKDPAITTDIITGFPGETDEEFAETVAFVEKVKFYEIHVFKYSKRQGTVAAGMPGQLTDAQKAARSEILLKQSAEDAKSYCERRIGTEQEVLFEEQKQISGKTYMVGHTKEYVQIALQTEENLSNQIITGTVTGFLDEGMLNFSLR